MKELYEIKRVELEPVDEKDFFANKVNAINVMRRNAIKRELNRIVDESEATTDIEAKKLRQAEWERISDLM